MERVIGSIRRECLDHVILFDEGSLRRILASYFDYYPPLQNAPSLGKDSPEPRAMQPADIGPVVAISRVGGLRHCYERRAAAISEIRAWFRSSARSSESDMRACLPSILGSSFTNGNSLLNWLRDPNIVERQPAPIPHEISVSHNRRHSERELSRSLGLRRWFIIGVGIDNLSRSDLKP